MHGQSLCPDLHVMLILGIKWGTSVVNPHCNVQYLGKSAPRTSGHISAIDFQMWKAKNPEDSRLKLDAVKTSHAAQPIVKPADEPTLVQMQCQITEIGDRSSDPPLYSSIYEPMLTHEEVSCLVDQQIVGTDCEACLDESVTAESCGDAGSSARASSMDNCIWSARTCT